MLSVTVLVSFALLLSVVLCDGGPQAQQASTPPPFFQTFPAALVFQATQGSSTEAPVSGILVDAPLTPEASGTISRNVGETVNRLVAARVLGVKQASRFLLNLKALLGRELDEEA